MLKDFVEKLKQMRPERVEFDPASLEDPVALETEWGPAKGGGANFRTHQLVQVDPNRIEFRASWGSKLFGIIFSVVGLGAMAVFISESMDGDEFALTFPLVLVVLLCSAFVVGGILMFFFFTAPIVFDRRVGAFWIGRTAPDQTFNRLTLKNYAELKDIHAIQLIAEYLSGSKTSYYSYELNLVLKDGKRFNVVDHGDKAKIIEDAGTLAEFLGVPVWNAIGEKN